MMWLHNYSDIKIINWLTFVNVFKLYHRNDYKCVYNI